MIYKKLLPVTLKNYLKTFFVFATVSHFKGDFSGLRVELDIIYPEKCRMKFQKVLKVLHIPFNSANDVSVLVFGQEANGTTFVTFITGYQRCFK